MEKSRTESGFWKSFQSGKPSLSQAFIRGFNQSIACLDQLEKEQKKSLKLAFHEFEKELRY
ncbi:hypothetical protein [Algoriphagus litoralis]|uniref:hypothetical protein n=1 Tax=Algoriphagus litoralis TaxID=2202829 RepID=UPI000DB948FD|nr:hypothetical protein [Algoriphagus litoralis]